MQKIWEWHEASRGPTKSLKGDCFIISWFNLDKAIHPNGESDTKFTLHIIGFEDEKKIDELGFEAVHEQLAGAIAPVWEELVKMKRDTFRDRVQSFDEQLIQLKLKFDKGEIDHMEWTRQKMVIYDAQQVLLQTAVLDENEQEMDEGEVEDEVQDEDEDEVGDQEREENANGGNEEYDDDDVSFSGAEIVQAAVDASDDAESNLSDDVENGVNAARGHGNVGNRAREREEIADVRDDISAGGNIRMGFQLGRGASVRNDARRGGYNRNDIRGDGFGRNNVGQRASVRHDARRGGYNRNDIRGSGRGRYYRNDIRRGGFVGNDRARGAYNRNEIRGGGFGAYNRNGIRGGGFGRGDVGRNRYNRNNIRGGGSVRNALGRGSRRTRAGFQRAVPMN